ncbi:MAG: YciI family protein [Bacillota bacterium]|nr:YciI family protein [Bacillota bacterium]
MKHYLLVTMRTSSFNKMFIQPHYEYLNKLKESNQLEAYGPFSDGKGGAYLIKSNSLEEAIEIGQSDPLVKSGSSTVMVKEWHLKEV